MTETETDDEVILRPAVEWFAVRMEKKLRENDHKGGWLNCTLRYLLVRMKNERDELVAAIHKAKRHAGCDYWRSEDAELVIREAADVSNFALMVADIARRSVRLEDDDV
jgi:hypothetical protein